MKVIEVVAAIIHRDGTYFATYKDNGIDYPCLKLKLGEYISIGTKWVNIYSIMRPGEIISTNDVLQMYESEK